MQIERVINGSGIYLVVECAVNFSIHVACAACVHHSVSCRSSGMLNSDVFCSFGGCHHEAMQTEFRWEACFSMET